MKNFLNIFLDNKINLKSGLYKMEKVNKLKFKLNKIYYSLFKERFNKDINFRVSNKY